MNAAVEHLKEDFAFSERRACEVLRPPVSTFRYRSLRHEDSKSRVKFTAIARRCCRSIAPDSSTPGR